METNSLKLSSAEQQLFADMFTYCDADNTGLIGHSKATNFMKNCALISQQTVEQIFQLIGCWHLSHLTRGHFYRALKLTAAAQSGLPLSSDIFTSLTIPLPQLLLNTEPNAPHKHLSSDDTENMTKTEITSHALPPPPTKSTFRSNRQWNVQYNNNSASNQQFINSQNNISINNNNNNLSDEQNEEVNSRSSSANEGNSSPSDMPYTYGEKSWSEFHEKEKDKPLNWADFDEGHHLLGNEDDEDEDDVDYAHNDNKSVASEEDENYDIWNISEEQRAYYTNQFKTMQKNITSKISGNMAKEFFEKSVLPINELSQIWQLSDIDKDGALTLDEFCIAMHLVVLRRNHIDIPNQLPISLLNLKSQMESLIIFNNDSICVDVSNNDVLMSETSFKISPQTQYNNVSDLKEEKSKADTLSPKSKEWTKFTDSPTNVKNVKPVNAISSPPSTSSSTPGMQTLANFDFNAASIVRDPMILHPIALRVSPDGQSVYNYNDSLHDSSSDNVRLTVNTNAYSYANVNNSGRKDPPPPPPPRPNRSHGHARSSSLDLNQFNRKTINSDLMNNTQHSLKVSSSEYGIRGPKEINPSISLNSSKHLGAFVAYRRSERHDSSLNANSWMDALKNKYVLPSEVPQPKNLNDSAELLQTIKALQEYSKTLVNINIELFAELLDVSEQKHKLELQLLQLNNGFRKL